MGYSQNYFMHWHDMQDVCDFVMSLSSSMRQSFLVVVSVVCWSVWKHRNGLVFQSVGHTSVRNLICLIISVVNYWSGGFSIALVHKMHMWLPENMEMIPLQVRRPVPQLVGENVEDIIVT
jgi:hypothetical protein